MRWDEMWEERDRKTLCNTYLNSISWLVCMCAQRDAIWSLLALNACLFITPACSCVCVCLQWFITVVILHKGEEMKKKIFTNAFWWIKFEIKFRTIPIKECVRSMNLFLCTWRTNSISNLLLDAITSGSFNCYFFLIFKHMKFGHKKKFSIHDFDEYRSDLEV